MGEGGGGGGKMITQKNLSNKNWFFWVQNYWDFWELVIGTVENEKLFSQLVIHTHTY